MWPHRSVLSLSPTPPQGRFTHYSDNTARTQGLIFRSLYHLFRDFSLAPRAFAPFRQIPTAFSPNAILPHHRLCQRQCSRPPEIFFLFGGSDLHTRPVLRANLPPMPSLGAAAWHSASHLALRRRILLSSSSTLPFLGHSVRYYLPQHPASRQLCGDWDSRAAHLSLCGRKCGKTFRLFVQGRCHFSSGKSSSNRAVFCFLFASPPLFSLRRGASRSSYPRHSSTTLSHLPNISNHLQTFTSPTPPLPVLPPAMATVHGDDGDYEADLASVVPKSHFRLKYGQVDAVCREFVDRNIAMKNGLALRTGCLQIVAAIKSRSSKYESLIPAKKRDSFNECFEVERELSWQKIMVSTWVSKLV